MANKALEIFLEHLEYELRYSPKTIDSYKRDIEKFLKYINSEGILMDDIDQRIINNFLTKEIVSGISKRSCKRRLSALKKFYHYMQVTGNFRDNPFDFIEFPKTDKTLPRVLYEDQVFQIIDDNKKRTDFLADRDQAILELLYYTGLRASELVSLTVQTVNIRGQYVRVIGKGNKERIVPFLDECVDALSHYVKHTRPLLASKATMPTASFFLNSKGQGLTTRGLEYILDQIDLKYKVLK